MKVLAYIFALFLPGAAYGETYAGDPCYGQTPGFGASCYSGAVTWLKSANNTAPACLLFELDNDKTKHFAIPDTALDVGRIWSLLLQARATQDEVGLYADGTQVACGGTSLYTLGWGVWVGVRAY